MDKKEFESLTNEYSSLLMKKEEIKLLVSEYSSLLTKKKEIELKILQLERKINDFLNNC